MFAGESSRKEAHPCSSSFGLGGMKSGPCGEPASILGVAGGTGDRMRGQGEGLGAEGGMEKFVGNPINVLGDGQASETGNGQLPVLADHLDLSNAGCLEQELLSIAGLKEQTVVLPGKRVDTLVDADHSFAASRNPADVEETHGPGLLSRCIELVLSEAWLVGVSPHESGLHHDSAVRDDGPSLHPNVNTGGFVGGNEKVLGVLRIRVPGQCPGGIEGLLLGVRLAK